MPALDIQSDELGFPEAGRIRLGVKVTNDRGTEYPRDVDHFVLRDAPSLVPYYGQAPQELLVYLPYPELERNFRVYHEEFRRGGLYCQGDGVHITWMVDPEGSGEVVIRGGKVIRDYQDESTTCRVGQEVSCSGLDHDLYPRCQNCKPRGLLFLLVRDPQEPYQLADRRLAYYRLGTSSVRNIRDITQQLNAIRQLASYMGRGLQGIPIVLRRVPGTVSVTTQSEKGEARRAQVEKHFLQVEVDPQWAAAASIAMAHHALGGQVVDLPSLPDVSGNGDAIEADFEEADPEPSREILDIMALRDDVPGNFEQGQNLMREFGGTALDERRFYLRVRRRLGVPRGTVIKWNAQTWAAMCDEMVALLSGEAA